MTKKIKKKVTLAEARKIKTFGHLVRAERERQGMSQEGMQNQRGYPDFRHWQRIEGGENNISFSTLLRVSQCLGVSLSVLFNRLENAAD